MPPTPPAIVAPAPEISPVDAQGRRTVAFDPGPVDLYAPIVSFPIGDPHVMRLGRREFSYEVPIPPGLCIVAVRSFIGWDLGSVGEATIEIIVGGFRVYERSDHKELPAHYDAWQERGVHFAPRAARPIVNFVFSAQMTAPRTFDQGLSTRAHGAFRLVLAADCDRD